MECGEEDWVELYSDTAVDLDADGYVLYDDKGPDDDDAFSFEGTAITMEADSFLTICR